GAALIATDVCVDVACGVEPAVAIFSGARFEPRISTVTYLELLASATPGERERLQRFVAAYAVLTLGPVASHRAVELMLQHRERGLQPTEALGAATALAHELPLITRNAGPYQRIAGLKVWVPY